MKMREALDVISGKADRSGYVVSFEVRERGMLRSDHFPDVREGEPGIATVEQAWELARDFARRRPDYRVNVHVCRATDFTRVAGETLNPYPPGE